MVARLQVWYRYPSGSDGALQRAEAIALEQSVEMPRAAIPPAIVEARVPGEVEEVTPEDDGYYRARVSYAVESTGPTATQLLNVLFGNTSLQGDVRLVDADFPEEVLHAFPGPRMGIQGLRDLSAAEIRPLTATALKPVGLDAAQLASLCEAFALAGLDWIKDDHGIADQAFAPFRARVVACQAAIRRAAERTGRQSLYIPNLSGGPTALFDQMEFARGQGVQAVMVSPMLVGIPVFEELTRRADAVAVVAHPALSGAPSIAPAFLFGRLYRLFGADAVIFVNYGGRFGYAPEECAALARNLREPWGRLRGSFPVPAGGMTVERVEEAVRFYGTDTALLVSGALYGPGDTLERESRRLVEAVTNVL